MPEQEASARPAAQTTLKEMKDDAAMRPGDNAVSVGLVDGPSFVLAQRIATMLAASTLVPKRFQGNVSNCVIALNMAARIGADPLMVMQNLYVVYGNPSWSAQFLVACFNKCGRFSSLRYEFKGNEGDDGWGCRAWAVEKETGERLDGTWVTIGLSKKEGWYDKSESKWKSMPQQMLMYRAAAWFVRAYAPEIAMGLHTADELRDGAIDVTPEPQDVPMTMDDLRAQQSGDPAPEGPPSPAATAGHPCAEDPDIKVSAETCRTCAQFPTCKSPHPDTK